MGNKLPKCGETHALIPLFIGVSAKVIEHITDDAYNRQGDFRRKSRFSPRKEGEKQSKTNRRAVDWIRFFMACTRLCTKSLYFIEI